VWEGIGKPMKVAEITKTASGTILVAVWEWRNGWNLVDTRSATPEEIQKFNAGNGLPVKTV
jgi:hypothetical protein